jgi:hypothetical protein
VKTNFDSLKWRPIARVDKFGQGAVDYVVQKTGNKNPDADTLNRFVKPYESITVEGNLLTTVGLNRLTNLLIGGGAQSLTATAVRLGVGDDATAAAVTDNDLSTTTNQYYRVMDSTYPTQANDVVTFKATFGTSDANFAWNCWGIDVGTPTVTSSGTVSALLFNRKVASLGTKSSGTWTLTTTVTFS